MVETLLKAAETAGPSYLANITVKPLNALDPEVAEFAILFALATRALLTNRGYALTLIGELAFYFKGEKKFDLIKGEVDAGGQLEWISTRDITKSFTIFIKKYDNKYAIKLDKVSEIGKEKY